MTCSIEEFRRYRISFSKDGEGIALFDLIFTFIIAYIAYPFINKYIKTSKDKYYMSLIPIGIVTHLIFNQKTFLNTQLSKKEINIYNVLVLLNIIYLFYSR